METGTILLTLDGSEFADQAIGYAQRLVTLAPNDPQLAAFLRELELLR